LPDAGVLLVTGGTGTLGNELVRTAPARGWSVRATYWTRPPVGDAEWLQADIRDAAAVTELTAGVDAVIHTAYRQDSEAWPTNVDGSQAVARAAAGRRLIHISSDLVFDGRRGCYREDDPLSPVNEYGRSKAEAEARVGAQHPDATIVRTSLIYGVPEGPQERLAQEGRRFFTDEIRSPVHVADLAAALLELLELDAPGPLHLGGGDDVSRYDFALLLGADPAKIDRAHTTPDRAPDVSLDSSRARAMLTTRVRGVYEVLGGR
jgi:dTDP-4-dehydrorhamnose reductase